MPLCKPVDSLLYKCFLSLELLAAQHTLEISRSICSKADRLQSYNLTSVSVISNDPPWKGENVCSSINYIYQCLKFSNWIFSIVVFLPKFFCAFLREENPWEWSELDTFKPIKAITSSTLIIKVSMVPLWIGTWKIPRNYAF